MGRGHRSATPFAACAAFIACAALAAACSLFAGLEGDYSTPPALDGGDAAPAIADASNADAAPPVDASDAAVADADAGPTYASVILADKPIAYYPLDGNGTSVLDKSGNGRDGTLNGAYTTSAAALVSTSTAAIAFAGGHIVFPKAVQAHAPISIEMWIRAESVAGTGYFFANDGFGFGWNASNGNSIHVFGNTGSYDTSDHLAFSKPYYLCLTVDPNMNFDISVGVSGVITKWGSGNPGGGTIQYGIGTPRVAVGKTGSEPFKGTIDEVAVYDVVLTPTQMARHYGAGLAK